jgi:hypothetical protein
MDCLDADKRGNGAPHEDGHIELDRQNMPAVKDVAALLIQKVMGRP